MKFRGDFIRPAGSVCALCVFNLAERVLCAAWDAGTELFYRFGQMTISEGDSNHVLPKMLA